MPITILSAGAGSGKTYTLTERMFELICQGVRPSGIVATTFTQKAAAELYERVCSRLLQANMPEAAQELGNALIGTVHSIGTRLLQRFAFEVGVSPLVEVIAESDYQRLFNEALAQVLDEQRIATMNHLADALGLTKKNTAGDWRRDIRSITEAARANMFSPEDLQHSRRRSWESFEALLPPCSPLTAEEWDRQLAQRIEQTIQDLENHTADDTKTTREVVEELRQLATRLRQRGFLYWYEWARLSKMRVGAKSRDIFEPLREFAHRHGEHPGFRADVRRYIELAFDIACDALDEYRRYKRRRGLIDYTDMETQVARLLRIPSVCRILSDEIDLLLVDEFQDTSPIQLDIFVRLSQLARQAIWVGDPKQSIYGFRGADPALMQAVVETTGGIRPENILRHSWRSRPGIVHFVNAVFTRAFSYLPAEQVALEPALPVERYHHADAPPALLHWRFLNSDNHARVPGSPWLEHAIARRVRRLLEERMPVWSKDRKATRPLSPGDVAILCRTNAQCEQMARALHHVGLKAAVARSGLLQTAEGRLAVACLKYLVNPADALSAAEILVLSGSQTLNELVAHRLKVLREHPYEPWEAEEHRLLKQLEQLRSQVADLSITETLGLVIAELHLTHLAARMGNAHQRLDNLDALRRYAAEYEAVCQRMHSGASLGGFLLWLDELGRADLDLQGSGESPNTVRVMTYHRSKGLEFPLVICCQLDSAPRDTLWGVSVQTDRPRPDLNDVLGGRWIRFWINPYADQERKTALSETLQKTSWWEQAVRQSRDEEARLLYVGLTRARDYLVLPTTARGAPWLNRVCYGEDEAPQLLDPQADPLPLEWQNQPLSCQHLTLYEPATPSEPIPPEQEGFYYFSPPYGKKDAASPPFWIDVLTEFPPAPPLRCAEPLSFAPPIPVKGEYSPLLDQAVRSFLSANSSALSATQRAELATIVLHSCNALEHIAPAVLVTHAEAFSRWLQQRVSASPVAAFPLEAVIDRRRIRLSVDLFAAADAAIVALFFADFAEGMKKWKEQLKTISPKVAWAIHLLTKAHRRPVECWAVFALEGQVVPMQVGRS